jgi:hypothetical protein
MAVFCGIDWAEGHHDVALVYPARVSPSPHSREDRSTILVESWPFGCGPVADLRRPAGELSGPGLLH